MRWPTAKSKRLLVILGLTFVCTLASLTEAESSEPAQQASPSPLAASSEQAAEPKKPTPEPERKARASEEAPSSKQAEVSSSPQQPKETDTKSKDENKSSEASKPASEGDKKSSSSSKPSSSSTAPKQQQLTGKSGYSAGNKSKLPANLGTVTSTGSGGPAHYMSKHDAYSAIAEKHGAMVTDHSRHTQRVNSDRRAHLQRFTGIQKASGGIGDMLNPFKGVSDSGLARTLGASMRSIMKSKYSIPAYLASAVLSAVAVMAFYESPISPLPVPELPSPPVGRFPPEMPNLPTGVQIPFRPNQQQQQYGQQAYANQRSFPGSQMLAQPQQQVQFPGAMKAQQRQMSSQSSGPVQQLAANLLSSVAGAKQQNAQRKSGLDYEASSSRSFFGGSAHQAATNQRLSAPANQKGSSSASSFLSYFGLGGSSAPANGANIQQASSNANSGQSTSIEPKGQASSASHVLSNSHVVNKVKSYFSRAPAAASSHSQSGSSPGANAYEQYQRMSFMQALAKDTAFLPDFLTSTRKSSPASSSSSSSSASAANKLQQSISNVLSAAAGSSSSPSSPSASGSNPQPIPVASRMQVDKEPQQSFASASSGAAAPSTNNRASSGYGLMRAVDRIAHALLDTFSMHQRNSPASSSPKQTDVTGRKSQVDESASPIMSTASLLSDIMLSSYNRNNNNNGQQPSVSQQLANSLAQVTAGIQQASPMGVDLHEQQQATGGKQQSSNSEPQQASARSDHQSNEQSIEQKQSLSSGAQQANKLTASTNPETAHVRKTRSVGLEYPTYELAQQQPSKAAQINNLVDLVSDSYKQNKMLFNFVINRVGLSHALPYVEQLLGDGQIVGLVPNQLIQ